MISATAAAPLQGHLVHVLLLAAWVPIFAGLVAAEKIKTRRRRRPAADTRRGQQGRPLFTQVMALGCVSAALVHAAVMPDHFEESIWYGGFFLATAAAQVGLAALLVVRPTRSLVTAGMAASAVVVALWLVSRLAGVPIGPDHGATEAFGRLDILASVAETATVIAGAFALRRWYGSPTWRLRMWSLNMRAVGTLCIVGAVAAGVVGPRS